MDRLRTCYRINHFLKLYHNHKIMEIETFDIKIQNWIKFVSELAIELGRYSNIPITSFKCTCEVQSVWHVFMVCPITQSLCRRDYHSMSDILADQPRSQGNVFAASRSPILGEIQWARRPWDRGCLPTIVFIKIYYPSRALKIQI